MPLPHNLELHRIIAEEERTQLFHAPILQDEGELDQGSSSHLGLLAGGQGVGGLLRVHPREVQGCRVTVLVNWHTYLASDVGHGHRVHLHWDIRALWLLLFFRELACLLVGLGREVADRLEVGDLDIVGVAVALDDVVLLLLHTLQSHLLLRFQFRLLSREVDELDRINFVDLQQVAHPLVEAVDLLV